MNIELTESQIKTLIYLLQQDYDTVNERVKIGESANIYSMAYQQLPHFKTMLQDIISIQKQLRK